MHRLQNNESYCAYHHQRKGGKEQANPYFFFWAIGDEVKKSYDAKNAYETEGYQFYMSKFVQMGKCPKRTKLLEMVDKKFKATLIDIIPTQKPVGSDDANEGSKECSPTHPNDVKPQCKPPKRQKEYSLDEPHAG